MNFIIDLSITLNDFNCLTTIINRFSKYIRLIFEKKIEKQRSESINIIDTFTNFEIYQFAL